MSLLILVFIFTCAASVMYVVYRNFPELSRWVSIKRVYFLWIHYYQVITTGLDLKFIFKAKHGKAAHQQSIFIPCKLWICKWSDGVFVDVCLQYASSLMVWMVGLVWNDLHDFFSEEMEKIKIPKDMDDAKALGTVLSKYKDTYYTQVLVAYFATYVLYPFGAWREKHLCFVLVHMFVFFCILDMLLTNLHPFTLISLFYVIAGQSQAQIQNKRTQQRSPFFKTYLALFWRLLFTLTLLSASKHLPSLDLSSSASYLGTFSLSPWLCS